MSKSITGLFTFFLLAINSLSAQSVFSNPLDTIVYTIDEARAGRFTVKELKVDSLTTLSGRLILEDGIFIEGIVQAYDDATFYSNLYAPNLDSLETAKIGDGSGFIVIDADGKAIRYDFVTFAQDLYKFSQYGTDTMDLSNTPIIASSLHVDELKVESVSTFTGEVIYQGQVDVYGNLIVRDTLNIGGSLQLSNLNRPTSEQPNSILGLNAFGQVVSLNFQEFQANFTPPVTGGGNPMDPICLTYGEDNQWFTSGNKIYTNRCTGNPQVGIGLIPEYRFDVSGMSRFDGQVLMGNYPVGQTSDFYAFKAKGVVLINAEDRVYKDGDGHRTIDALGDQARVNFGDHHHYIGIKRYSASGFESKSGLYLKTYLNDGIFLQEGQFGGGIGIKTNDPKADLHIAATNDISFLVQDKFGSNVFAIDGKRVFARDITVTEDNFPDYVFHKDYELRSFEELENFILEYHRLPNMPSAEEVDQNGMKLNEVTRLLVEKVEELTLYMLELKKENNSLKKEIESLKK